MKKATKWKNVTGELTKKARFMDIMSPESNVEGNLLDVNTNFLAVAWKGKNGNIAIYDPSKPDRTPANYPLIKPAHDGNITDLKFSPFRTNILASGGEDGLLKLWDIPEGLLKEDMSNEIQKYSGHHKKISLLEFNPVCGDVITSASNDMTVHTINLVKAEPISVVELSEAPSGMTWNHNGSTLAVASKMKTSIIDPRTKAIVSTISTHEGNKLSKVHFVDENTILSVGAPKSSKKEAKLFDLRKVTDGKLSEFVSKCEFDISSNFFWSFYDDSRKLAYVTGKGDYTFSIVDANDGVVGFLGKFVTVDHTSVCQFPVKLVDYNSLEIMRFMEISKGTIATSSVHVPRKVKSFDPAFYPPVFSGEQAIDVDAWTSGSNAEPIIKEIKTIENKWVSEPIVYVKKEEVKKLTPEEENKQLKLKIETLEQENSKLKDQVKALTAKVEGSAKLEEEIKTLKAKLEEAEKAAGSSEIPPTNEEKTE